LYARALTAYGTSAVTALSVATTLASLSSAYAAGLSYALISSVPGSYGTSSHVRYGSPYSAPSAISESPLASTTFAPAGLMYPPGFGSGSSGSFQYERDVSSRVVFDVSRYRMP